MSPTLHKTQTHVSKVANLQTEQLLLNVVYRFLLSEHTADEGNQSTRSHKGQAEKTEVDTGAYI